MTYLERIADFALDHHYLISTRDAASLGIPPVELAKLAHRGKLENLARGLYRDIRYVPSQVDPYAVAVARVGEGAYLYGESVLAMLDLAPTNLGRIFVATPRRVRLSRQSPSLSIIQRPRGDCVTEYEGIPCQTVAGAIRSCTTTIMPERLAEAISAARKHGYLTAKEMAALDSLVPEALV